MKIITLTLICSCVFAFTAYSQKKAYKVIIPNTIMYLSDKPPLKEIKTLSNKDTVVYIGDGARETVQVDYQGTKGYVSKNNLFEVPYSASIERHTLLPINSETSKVDFTKVVEAPNITKAELFTRAKQWIAVSFKSANAVIQMEDKEEGIIIGKGVSKDVSKPGSMAAYTFAYTIKIYLKEGRYKYSLTDISYPTGGYTIYSPETFNPVEPVMEKRKGMREALIYAVSDLVKSLNQAMVKPVTGKSDW